jgi:hypothetical protein
VEQIIRGQRMTVTERSGYVAHQYRPHECRPLCECGKCNGIVTAYEGVVTGFVRWADNSRDATVLCDDGISRTVQLVGPSGDACF